MATASGGKIMRESAQTAGSGALTDSGDQISFNSSASIWSKRSGYTPTIIPNGLISGGTLTPNAANDTLDFTAIVCNLNGTASDTVAASTVAITRDGSNDYAIHSITINTSGSVVAVAGTADAAALDPTGARGGSGAPPYIPTTSIEIGQIHITSKTAAAITTSEIKQVPGTHVEYANSPGYEIKYARVSSGALGYAGVDFDSALPAIHTGDVAKAVHAEWYVPSFTDIPVARNFKPAYNTVSSTSSQWYKNKTFSSQSLSLSDSTFEIYLQDGGITDSILDAIEEEELWFKAYQDQLASEYILTLGKAVFDQTLNVDSDIIAAVTLSPTAGKSMRITS